MFRNLTKTWRKRRKARRPLPASWSRMDSQVRTVLEGMYAGESQLGSDGELHPLDGKTKISPQKGAYLFELHERLRPERSVEIGLAYGYSTLYLFAAMKNGGYGHHVAIDPFQEAWFHGVGEQQAPKVGMQERFTFVDDYAVSALSKMAAAEERAQFIYIDGDHKFDSVLMDFTCAARICDIGGHIVMDDLWMPGIRKVASFVRKNRADFVTVPSPVRNFVTFRRVTEDERPWTHYRRF